jgi:hypothetical protein
LEPDIESGALSHGIEEQSRQAGLDAVRTINADRLLSVIARYASGSRLLDVGSGPGFFLALAIIGAIVFFGWNMLVESYGGVQIKSYWHAFFGVWLLRVVSTLVLHRQKTPD